MNQETFKPYYDIREHQDEVIARVFQEERRGVEAKKRIVHAQDYFQKRIEEDNWEYNEHSQAEKTATMNAFELFAQGYQLAVWISPVSEIYEEGRLNILLPGEKNGEKIFEAYGLPLLASREESLKMTKALLDRGGVTMDNIYSTEEVRKQPVAFDFENKNWLKKCREILPQFEWAWETIESGEVDENMKKIAREVKEAREIAGRDNYLFERIMLQSGYRLNISGSHGGSWLSGELGRTQGIIALNIGGKIEYRLGRTEGLHYCEHCGCWYSGEKCPVCK